MVQIVAANDHSFRIDLFGLEDLASGTIVSRSATSFVVDTGHGYVDTFTGTGFTYDGAGDPLGGTITGISETLNGDTSFTMTGLNVSIADFEEWAFDRSQLDGFAELLAGNDGFTGSDFNDYISGFAGHDTLAGGAGSDTLSGGDGNDHIYGQSANGGTDSGDALYGRAGNDYIQGNAGGDDIDGGLGNDRIQGGQGDDLALGYDGNDTINGNLGDDVIGGEAGNDSLRGGQGNDYLSGGTGNDMLQGDLGADTLRGGDGADRFVFTGQASPLGAAVDHIRDFGDGDDRVVLGFTVSAVLTGSPQTEAAAAAFAQQLLDANPGTGEVAAVTVGDDLFLYYASSGGATIDSLVLLEDVSSSTISLADFG